MPNRFALAALALIGVGAGYHATRPTPEQAHRRELQTARENVEREIARCRRNITADRQAVYDARVFSYRARGQGAEAVAVGERLRARSERMRQANMDRLNTLLIIRAEAEMDLREH